MENQRRLFLNRVSLMAGIAALGKPLASAASISRHINTLHATQKAVTIYHTNDLHGNLDAAGNHMGGLNMINTVLKNQETAGLLVDGGNFLNGRQSIAQQKMVIQTMNRMGYHAATLGNHELAQGEEHLAALAPLMRFNLVNCNYQFAAALGKFVKPYVIIRSGNFRVGITGVGRELKGIKYNDAIACANNTAAILKRKEKCDLVICLSHLGYAQDGNKPDNKKLAQQSENIDMIVSGHNLKLMSGPMILRNKLNHEVMVSHAAWDGLMVGKTVFNFANGRQKHNVKPEHFIPGQAAGQTFASSFAELRLLEKQRIAS